MLQKKLIPIGDSTGLIIDKALLRLLSLSQGDDVKLELLDGKLVVSGVNSSVTPTETKPNRLTAIRARMHADHAEVFKKLAK